MPRYSCLYHPPDDSFLPLYVSYTRAFGGDVCCGAIISLLDWMTMNRMEELERNGATEGLIWITATPNYMYERMSGIYSLKRMRERIEHLVKNGFIKLASGQEFSHRRPTERIAFLLDRDRLNRLILSGGSLPLPNPPTDLEGEEPCAGQMSPCDKSHQISGQMSQTNVPDKCPRQMSPFVLQTKDDHSLLHNSTEHQHIRGYEDDELAALAENQNTAPKAEQSPSEPVCPTLDIDPRTGKPFEMEPTHRSVRDWKGKKPRKVGLAAQVSRQLAPDHPDVPLSTAPKINARPLPGPYTPSPPPEASNGHPTEPKAPPNGLVAFQELWEIYPAKGRVRKADALEEYKKQVHTMKEHEAIMEAIEEWWKPSAKWRDGYVMALPSWIRNRSWEEEPEPAEPEDEGPQYPRVKELLAIYEADYNARTNHS